MARKKPKSEWLYTAQLIPRTFKGCIPEIRLLKASAWSVFLWPIYSTQHHNMTGIDCKGKNTKMWEVTLESRTPQRKRGRRKGLNFAKNASNSGWMVHVSNQTFLKASFALFYTFSHFYSLCKNPNMIRILLSWKIWNPAKRRGALQLSDRLVWNEKCKALMKIQKNILPKPKRSKWRKHKFWGILPAFRSRLFCSSNVPSLDLDSTNFSRKAYPKRSSSQEING